MALPKLIIRIRILLRETISLSDHSSSEEHLLRRKHGTIFYLTFKCDSDGYIDVGDNQCAVVDTEAPPNDTKAVQGHNVFHNI